MLFRLWDPSAVELPDLAWVPDRAGHRHLLVGRHGLVREVLSDPATYRPDNALDAMTPMPVAALRILARYGFRLPPTLANNGGESHPGIRDIVADALHPTRVAEQRPWLTAVVRERVASLTARLRADKPIDLYADLAADLPLLVLARLVDLPAGEVAVVKQFSRAALELFWAPVDPQRQQDLADIVGRYEAVLRGFVTTASGMVARLREHGLHTDLLVAAMFFLLVAGQETTSQFLTLLMHRLIDEPAVLAGLAGGRVGLDDVVEEGLRLEPPIVAWRRLAGRDTVLGGQKVHKGASIVLWLARAGRDAALTLAPDSFVPGQSGSRRHLAFGAGAHRCVGAQLARMEAAVVVAETAPLLSEVRVLRAPWCPDNLSFRMPDALLVQARDSTGPVHARAAQRA